MVWALLRGRGDNLVTEKALTERLRKGVPEYFDSDEGYLPSVSEAEDLMREAADALDARDAEIESLRAALRQHQEQAHGRLKLEQTAHAMLDAVDGFMAGADQTEAQRELEKSASRAGVFAAAAYEAAPKGGTDIHALTRVFLLALIDPTDQALDYLRADPAAGAVAREAAARLHALSNPSRSG